VTAYDARLATRISKPVRVRLRIYADLQGQAECAVLDAILNRVLPSAEELARQLAGSPAGAKSAKSATPAGTNHHSRSDDQ
jgi:hypothetical protein